MKYSLYAIPAILMLLGNSCSSTENAKQDALPVPVITMVTIDDKAENIDIYWDKKLYQNVETYIVFREDGGAFKEIGKVAADQGHYLDADHTAGQPNGDPNKSSHKYKLQYKNTSGEISEMSSYHQTIFLTNDEKGKFTWNYYADENNGERKTLPYTLWRINMDSGDTIKVLETLDNFATDSEYALHRKNPKIVWMISTEGFDGSTNDGKTRTKSNNTNEFLSN